MTTRGDDECTDAISTGVFTGFIAGWCSCMALVVITIIIIAMLVYAYQLNNGV